jgi:hypothetical protein
MRYTFLFLGVTLLATSGQPTAREYYEELKAANAFNHYMDEYVCFRDDDVPSFFVMSKADAMIERMRKAGDTPGKELMEAKDFLFVKNFHKGVHVGEPELYQPVGTEGTDFDIEFMKPFHGRMLYTFNWLTVRYRMQLYELDHSKTLPAFEGSGKCELIHTAK